MARKQKTGKTAANKEAKPSKLRFELEDDAEDLFLNHLQEFKPEKVEADEKPGRGRKSSKSKYAISVHELDLHGLTLDQAQNEIRTELNELREWPGLHRIRIITGKGHHSHKGEGILAKEIHGFVMQVFGRFIINVESSPDEVRLNGVPLRGHFELTLLGKSRNGVGRQ
ncbi:MAG: Smr/MutS family protein [Proteobacteria bacterium]|nr:Smr/MutS family protein [Pseudomonadota bacterium]